MKPKKFERIIDGVKITVIVESTVESNGDWLNGKLVKKTDPYTLDGVVTQFLELEYTYGSNSWAKTMERRRLFAKMSFDKENFTKKEADKLAKLTSELSDYAGNYADGLFYEFVNELDKSGGLAAYRKIVLTDEEKAQRRSDAEKLLAKLREKRNKGIS